MKKLQCSETVASSCPAGHSRIAIALLLAFSVSPVMADEWIGPDGGDWFDLGNWQAGVLPTATNVRIDNHTSAVINGSPPDAQGGGSALRVGITASGGLNILGGGSLSNFNGVIGYRAGSSGTVTVSGAGSIWTNSATLASGYSGTGLLAITEGGVVTSASTTAIGLEATGVGSIEVDGTGSTLNVGNNLYIGSAGLGTLSIQSGGSVVYAPGIPDRAIYIGQFAQGVGAVTVDGAGSSLASGGGHFYVGAAGSGWLTIQNGGVVTHTRSDPQSRIVSIGSQGGATGVVMVSDIGSRLSTTENLLVGASGAGTLNILNGGMVENDGFGLIGNLSANINSRGTVTVDGAGSTWLSNGSLLFVGDQTSGSLTLTNGGMVRINAGAGTAFVGSAASGVGVLNIGAGGGAGVLDAATVNGGSGSATLNFNHTASDYFFTRDGTSAGAAIAITGSTAVNHNGSGTTVLTGTNTYSGATNVNAGRLIVDGSLSGNTFVNAGGTLGGSGTVGNLTVSSGGTLSPGNSPGILNVAGDFTLNAGSLTVMEIDGYTPGTQHDQVNVSGTARLDGTLQLDFGFVPVNGDRFNLINAASVVPAGDPTTGFADIGHNLGAAILATAVIDPESFDILVQMEQGSFVSAAGSGLTRNQFNVATSLDGFATSGLAPGLFSALNTLSAGQLPNAFDQLSGVQHTHAAMLYPRINRQFHDVLAQRMSGHGSPRSDLATPDDRHVWLQAVGGFGNIDGDRNASGADYQSGGIALGAEADVSERVTVGAALAYTRSDVDMRRAGIEIDSYQAAFYGNWQRGDTYVRGSTGLGYHDTSASRRLSLGGLEHNARANYDGWTAALSLEAGKAITLSESVVVTPLAGIDYVHVTRSRFTEKEGGDTRLTVSSDHFDSLQSVLGARVQSNLFADGERRVSSYLEAAWLHEFADRGSNLRAGFATAPDSDFRIFGPRTDRDRARVGAGIKAQMTETLDLELAYRGDIAHSDKSHLFAATVRMRW